MCELRNDLRSVVFIGDSITDCGRTYPTVSEYGRGFAALCIEWLRQRFPGVPLYNRGVAGQCIGQIHARWQEDCLALRPGLVTLLAGINDVDYSYRRPDHVFDQALLARQLEEMCLSARQTGAMLILMEPYAFEGELYHDAYAPRLHWLRGLTAEMAAKYASAYLQLPMRPELTQDGIHPTEEGHRLLSQCWLQAAENCGALKQLTVFYAQEK